MGTCTLASKVCDVLASRRAQDFTSHAGNEEQCKSLLSARIRVANAFSPYLNVCHWSLLKCCVRQLVRFLAQVRLLRRMVV